MLKPLPAGAGAMQQLLFWCFVVGASALNQKHIRRGLHRKPHHHQQHHHDKPVARSEALSGVPAEQNETQLPGTNGTPIASNQLASHFRVEADLSLAESHSLVQGVHFGTMAPDPGFYIGTLNGIDRLQVPPLKMQDGGNGFRNTLGGTDGTTTMWPCSLALASTWDEALVHEVAKAMGREFKGKGANVMLGPAVNVHRVALNGRNFEYLSGEDPYLGSRLATAFVTGVQGEGVMATLKHFAFNEQESNRMLESSHVDETTAWELYYPPFEAGVKAGAGAVMCAYNRVNGTFACHNSDLLNRDLRGVMGFDGLVMSDWGATHGVDALTAGMDLEMPGKTLGSDGVFHVSALADVDARVLKAATAHVRQAVIKVGLDTNGDHCMPGTGCMERLHSMQTSQEHSALSRTAASSSVVLLKNENYTLPIDPARVKHIAILGTAADFMDTAGLLGADYYSGGGSGHVGGRPVTSPLRGIENRASQSKVQVRAFTDNKDVAQCLETARDSDLVVFIAATTSSEMIDRQSLMLDHDADLLLFRLGELNIPTVVLMQTPGAVLTPWRELGHIKSIANLFLPGEEAGNAWADVVFGDVNPSGKLPIMLPSSQDDHIAPASDPMITYSEGLFTSYRSPTLKWAFPFGHGLSYTTFKYGQPRAVPRGCSARACVVFDLTNTGTRGGAEVAQAYLQHNSDANEPKRQLRGLRKVWLDPQQTESVMFALTERDLSVYRQGKWVRQRDVTIHIGSSSADIKKSIRLVSK